MSAAIPGGRSEIEKLARQFATEFVTGHYHEPSADEAKRIDQLFVVMLAFSAASRSALLTAAGSAPVTPAKHKICGSVVETAVLNDDVAIYVWCPMCRDLIEDGELDCSSDGMRLFNGPSTSVPTEDEAADIHGERQRRLENIAREQEILASPAGAAVTAQAPPPEIEDAFKAGFDAHIRGHRGAKGCASAFAEYVKPNQVPTAAQAPAPTDLERYDAATIVHAKEREQEYRRTIWAAAAALWPNPLRVPQITRDAYTRSSELQTRTDPATGDLLLFAARPSLPVQE